MVVVYILFALPIYSRRPSHRLPIVQPTAGVLFILIADFVIAAILAAKDAVV